MLGFKGKPYPTKIIHDKLYELLLQNRRLDGRRPDEMRPVSIQTGLIKKAAGSALVSMGGTKILAGVKMDLTTPYPDTPDVANITVNAELLPLASSTFEPGPPDERAIELARVVDRCIRESKAIELEKLAYIPGQRVAVLYIDIYVLDYDGNYFDPSVLAAVAALSTARIPRYEVRNGSLEKVEGETESIPMRRLPVSVTMGLIMDRIIVDPTPIEENALDASIVFGWGSSEEVAAIQKNSPGLLPLRVVGQLLEVSKQKSEELRSRLIEAINQHAPEQPPINEE